MKRVFSTILPVFCTVLVGLSEAINPNCNFESTIVPDHRYYIYNLDYPRYSVGENSCQWKAKSDYRIRLYCKIELPKSNNCTVASLSFDDGEGATRRFCGTGNFTLESHGGEVNVTFLSSRNIFFYSRFLCEVTAMKQQRVNCVCGRKNPTRIVGGTETGVNEFPSMAGLVDFTLELIYCGATIISDKYVVTAAHCVFNRNQSDLGVIVGEHDVTTGKETNATKLFLISGIVMHELYKINSYANDIAIVQIQGLIKFNMAVSPICLPFLHAADTFVEDVVEVLGWGLEEFGGSKPDVLMKAPVTVIPNYNCSKDYQSITYQNLCTLGKKKDACQFDSGGPVLWGDLTGGRLVLIGVISKGKGCASGIPGLNTRVTAYLDWILKTTDGTEYCAVE